MLGVLNAPHRAHPGVPTGLAPVGRWLVHKKELAARLAPTGLAPVERGFVHRKGGFSPFSAPTGLAPVERRLLHQRSDRLVFKPPLHRGEPGGGVCPRKSSLVHKPSVHQDEPGGDAGASPVGTPG